MAPRPRQPRHGRDRRRHRPDAERAPPAQVRRVGQRHRDPGRHGSGPAHGHRVDAHHQAGAVGEVPLDQRGQQDVADRDRPADDDRAGEQHRRPVEDAHENARRECRHHPGQHRFDAEPAGQPRRDGREQAEAQHRNGGQRCRADARQRKTRPQLGQYRPDPGDRGPQVGRDEHNGQRQQHRVPPRRRRTPPVGAEIPSCHRAVIPTRLPSGRAGTRSARAGTRDSPCRNARVAVPERASRRAGTLNSRSSRTAPAGTPRWSARRRPGPRPTGRRAGSCPAPGRTTRRSRGPRR